MYILDVRLPVALLQALVPFFQDDATMLSLEGNLSRLDGHLLEHAPVEDWPQSGTNRVVRIPLTEKNVNALIRSILPRVGLHRHVYHVLIRRGETYLFAAYDHFSAGMWQMFLPPGPYNKAATVSADVSPALLTNLVTTGILRHYVAHTQALPEWEGQHQS